MSAAEAHIADTLTRAQHCWKRTVDHRLLDTQQRAVVNEAVNLFISHITAAVLLEHIRRLDPALAEQLVPWLLSEDGIFCDGYAGELLHLWRQQLAAGQPMDPIAPQPEEVPA